MRRLKHVLLWVMALLYVFAGFNHLANPEFYLAIIPPELPNPEWLNLVSGLADVLEAVERGRRLCEPREHLGARRRSRIRVVVRVLVLGRSRSGNQRSTGKRRFSAAPSGRSSRTIFSGAFWSCEKSSRPSERSGNHKLCRHINDGSGESKPGRADSEGTDNLGANASQKDVSDKLSRS